MPSHTKFFAIINDEKRGPFTLAQLEEAGVGPDTYVWCKGMQKWRRARHVADVCRYWRQRLAGEIPAMTEQDFPEVTDTASSQTADHSVNEWNGIHTFRTIRSFDPAGDEPGVDLDTPPRTYLLLALAVTFLCMPLTGFIALYFTSRSKALWSRASEMEQTQKEEILKLKRGAHDSARSAKMWIGITFFLGFIVQGFMMRYAASLI